MAGVEYEGETTQPQPEDVQAINVHAMLANGMGGHDWAGLPYACAYFGVTDVEGLMHRLVVIKTHRPPKEA